MSPNRLHHGKCTVPGCDDDEKSLFSLRSVEPIKQQWLNFIYSGNVPAYLPKSVYVCAKHFRCECFHNLGPYIAGFATNLKLKPGSVPSIPATSSVTNVGQVKTEEDADSSNAPQPFLMKTKSVACQTERRGKASVGTQLSMRTLGPKFCSKETQTPAMPKMSLGNGTDLLLPMAKNELTGQKNQGFETLAGLSGKNSLVTENQNLSFLKSDKIGLNEEATVKVSCLLQLFDRCIRCKGEAYSLVTHREGAEFTVAQMCWTCHFTVTWASHSQLAAVQNEEERVDGNEVEEEESDQDMEEDEEEKQARGTKRKRGDSDEEWAPDVEEFTREFVRQSSDDSEGSSCEEDEDNDDDSECASELLVWCSECKLKVTNRCLRHKHPLLYCCVLCGDAEPHEDCTGVRGTDSTCDSEEPLQKASCISTPEGEAERSSDQQVHCSLQHVTKPGHLEEAGIGPEGPTCTDDHQGETGHIQPICAISEGPLSINNQSGATTEVPHRKDNQSGASSEGQHSANNEIQEGNTGCELESAPSKPPFAVCFSDPYNLQSHMEQRHYNQWQRKLCTDCGKFFIKRNTAMAHDCDHKVKPFICATCEKRFSTEAGLHTHQYVHKEERLVYCQFCFKGFRQTEDKVKHEESHQGEALKFYCRECPKRFADRHSRSVHRKTHWTEDRFFCKYCDKGFKAMNHLRRHKLLHTGKKPFTCEVCDRSFNQSGHLKSHMRLHTGERPFKCPQCERSFNHNVSLKNHLQRHHGPKTATAEQENQE